MLVLKKPENRKTDEGGWKLHLEPRLKSVPLHEVKNFQIVGLRNDLESKNLSPQTVKHCLALLKRILHKALEWEIYPGPVPIFSMPSFDNRRLRFLTKDESTFLLGELSKHSELLYDIANFSIYTGLRAGEILKLTASDIDLNAGYVHVMDTKKNNRNRSIPLNKTTHRIASKYSAASNSEPLFCNAVGSSIYLMRKVFP